MPDSVGTALPTLGDVLTPSARYFSIECLSELMIWDDTQKCFVTYSFKN